MPIKIKFKQRHLKFFLALSVLVGAVVFLRVLYSKEIKKRNRCVVGEGSYKEITIRKGASVEDISNLLKREGLINSKGWFKLYVLVNSKNLQAGNFVVPTTANIVELAALLGKGSFQTKFTFFEGLRVEQIAEILPKNVREGFLQSSYTREGFMFPDTYFFAEDADGNSIAKTLRQTFDERIGPLAVEIRKSPFSLEEVVTLASIVEREAKSFDDKATVAGILIKRYKNGWPLQADATVQYARDSSKAVCGSAQDCGWWGKLSPSDLDLESSYNTYRNAGLPPAPICNPGIDSIKAVLEYKKTPYWFYLTGKDGTTHYSKTVEEHNRNVKRYL